MEGFGPPFWVERMNNDVYETPDGVKLRWIGRDLSSLIRISAENYRKLLENPDFVHDQFLLTGGFPHLMAYKGMIETLIRSEAKEHATVNLEECYSYATRIEEIYNKRWEIKE